MYLSRTQMNCILGVKREQLAFDELLACSTLYEGKQSPLVVETSDRKTH